jgi:tetratricopeptide (TPR) repeat protein/O-antigen ligase
MEYLSRLARRASHLLTLEALGLAVLAFPLQLPRENLQALRAWVLRPAWLPHLRHWGINPDGLWDYDLSAILNSGFDPLVLKEVLFKAAILFALIAWAFSHLLRAGGGGSGKTGRLRLIWLVLVVAVLTGSFYWGTQDGRGGRRMVWLESHGYFAALAGLAFLFLLGDLVRCRRQGERWIAFLYVVAAPVMIVSLLQHLGNWLLPEDRYQWLGVIPLARGEELSRNVIGSLIGHNNGAALITVPGLCLAPGVWRRTRRVWLRAALVAWIALALWVIVRSQSRSVVLAVVLGAAVWFAISWLRLPRPDRSVFTPQLRRWALIALGVFLLTQVIPGRNPLRATEGLGARFRRIVDPNEFLIDTRARVFAAGLPAFRDKLLTGWGIGSFTWVYPYYQGLYFSSSAHQDTRLALTDKLTNAAHDDWLQLAIELGIVGIAVVIWGLILWWGRGWRFLRRGACPSRDRPLVAGVLCAGVIWMFQAAFDFPMHVTPTAVIPLVLAVLAGNAPEIWGPQRFAAPVSAGRTQRLWRWAAAAALLAWCLWPPRWWFGPAHSLNPAAMAPSFGGALRPVAAELLADERHTKALGRIDQYFRHPEIQGTPAGQRLLAEARSTLREAILLEPANGEIRHQMAETLHYLSAWNPTLNDDALEEFAFALKEVRNFRSLYFIAECHRNLAAYHGGLADDALAAGDTARADAERQRQRLHWDEAIRNYYSALLYNPSDVWSGDSLAKMLLEQGDTASAVGVIKTVRRWSPGWYEKKWVGDTIEAINLGRFDQALSRLRVICEIEPDRPEYFEMAADCYLRQGDVERARSTIEDLHRRFPNAPLGHLDVELLVAQGDLEGAVTLARQDYASTHDPHLLYLEHLALRKLGRTDEAQRVYEQIVQDLRAHGREPEQVADVLGNLAWDLFDDRESAEAFYRSIADNPPGPIVLLYYRLALLASERGQTLEALDYLGRLRAKVRDYEPAETLWNQVTGGEEQHANP